MFLKSAFPRFFVVSCLVFALESHADVFTVGTAGNGTCDFGDLQAAVDAALMNGPGPDEIHVGDLPRNNQLATITDQELIIEGGYENCDDPSPGADRTQMIGILAAPAPLLSINGSASTPAVISMRNFHLLSNNAASGISGALLAVSGTASVTIENTLLQNGRADRGGAVWVNGAAASVELLDDASSVFANNAIVAGGGVYCDNGASFVLSGGAVDRNRVLAAGPFMDSDLETGNGGGIYAANGCSVIVRAGRTGQQLGVVQNQASRHGGGLFATGGVVMEALGDSIREARFSFNIAAADGGAIAVLDPVGSPSMVLLEDATLQQNRALRGGGFSVIGGDLRMARTLGPAACHAPVNCAFVGQSQALSSSTSAGAVAYIEDGTMTLESVAVRSSTGTSDGALFHLGPDAHLEIENGLITNTSGTIDHVVEIAGDSAQAHISQATISGNIITVRPDSRVFRVTGTDAEISMTGTVVDDAYANLLEADQPITAVLDCLLLRDSTEAGAAMRTVAVSSTADVRFSSTGTNGDYTLEIDSPAVDFCDSANLPPSSDFRLGQRPKDVLSVADLFGPVDLGMSESIEQLFADGFEL